MSQQRSLYYLPTYLYCLVDCPSFDILVTKDASSLSLPEAPLHTNFFLPWLS